MNGDNQAFHVRTVSTAHSTPNHCEWNGQRWVGVGRLPGSVCLQDEDVMSIDDLLRDLDTYTKIYGYRARSTRITGDYFRWTFERFEGGHRLTDMIIARRIV